MADPADRYPAASGREDVQRVVELLGGSRVFRHELRTPLEAHDMLMQGLPGRALDHLFGNLVVLKRSNSLDRAVGMSLRTLQRRRESPEKPLGQEQSGRAWKFAEILAKATEVFGSQEEAEQWLDRPATGLDQRRPIDLLATPAGVEMVQDFLHRLEYGVYT
ncbi:DUF2384 domain-containing protein [Skermanella mucosa]|uniref:type II RES/Xre toxin-antitoxin system antitoxin n=1 Tax=Skermanella mucosa TaxID=1789672 RepID=UPI00192C153A|nr:antitoxin Xre/MbcA/ParS toxin-binding domain-containing protein [Skermanella mucosa]UEM21565.1 DUF2384 domain-containing protein [Skermanella mucosa]